jgi:branched-chain amino acid transport system substrate-binding protein
MNRTRPRARSVRSAAAVTALLCLLATSACGTRLTDNEIAQDQAVAVTGANVAPGSESSGSTDVPVANGAMPLATNGPAAPAPGTAANNAAGAAVPGKNGGANASKGGAGTGAVTAPSGSKFAAKSAGSATADDAPCTRPLAPIVIGQTGAFSGLLGGSMGLQRLGLSVWANWVNANGGIRCHPVKLYQMDDGSDPSKTASNINDLVTNKKAIALVGVNVPITMGAARSAAARLGVPLVGGDGGDDAWNTDPNAFQSGGSFTPASAGGFVDAVRETGSTKLGLIYCIEATPCAQMHKQFDKVAAASGGQIAFQQGVSLTQSDYTAECQNLKNAGAQIVGLYVDAASQQRVARSCMSIGYKPALETGGLSVSPTVINDANIRALTEYVGNINAPYTSTGTPALDALHAAFKTHTGADVPDQPSVIGWTAGILFKEAIESLDATVAKGAITTAMVYDGLYALKDNTLGGLAPPLKFTRGQGSGIIPCFTTFKISTKGIELPGPKFKCMQWKA